MAVRFRYRVEYALLRGSAALLNALPYPLALAFGAGLAALTPLFGSRRVVEARRRIAEVFPEKSQREVRRIARIALRNLAFNLVEALRFPHMTREWIERHVDVGNFDNATVAHIQPGQGALFVVPHMGNWEMAGLVAGQRGLPIFLLVGRQRNPLTDTFMREIRSATGVTVVVRDQLAVRNVLRNLRVGKALAILPDLRMPTTGVPVNFLGRDVEFPGGTALFARHTHVPVCIGHVRRVGWTKHVWEFLPPMWSDPALSKEEDAQRILQTAADHFSEAIRRHPEQYFWFNKRWVLEARKKS
ncbi:MAG: lysophospholipid acyltransferase family protein [Kiritimatiellae bacterium]|nr:lysophospholipid acyltransferase family protein [Kiritimatiellia bacterium]